MLQALTKKGRLVTPATWTREEQQRIRLETAFYCPSCKEKVIFRAGAKVIPHFAHQKISDCFERGGESFYHMKGKLQLYQWLKRQYKRVYLEKYIPTIQQQPDVYVEIAHRKIAIELQCSQIDPKIIRQRNIGYKKVGITPIWILGANRFRRVGQQKIKINAFTMEVLQKFSSSISSQLLYYDPDAHGFFKASELYLVSPHYAITCLNYHQAHATTFPQLLYSKFLDKRQLYKHWLYEKKRFRLGKENVFGRELKWRQWIYKQGLYLEQLPSIVHLPIAAQFTMKVPLWHWQSYFVLQFLQPLSLGITFTTTEMHHFLCPYQKRTHQFPLIQTIDDAGHEYISMLCKLGYIKQLNENTFQKISSIEFPLHIEEALALDRTLIKKLYKISSTPSLS